MLKSQSTIIITNTGAGTQSSTRVLPAIGATRMLASTASVSDAASIARHIGSIHRELDALSSAVSTPLLGSVVVQGLSFTGGTARYVQHQLGRAPQGWLVTRAKTAAWSGYELTLETGRDATKEIRLQTTTTGTFDILFF
ncbi:MAG: hypothetical protein EBR82_12195 [Caulobacteraceae bacterium]|nr:hypothetical protein [Caulobacteraceae bacterium]